MSINAGPAWARTSSKLAAKSSSWSVSQSVSQSVSVLHGSASRPQALASSASAAAAAAAAASAPRTLLMPSCSAERKRVVMFGIAVHSSAKAARSAQGMQCCLTPRSNGAPTACHQGPPAVQYIVCRRALAACRRRPLSSNVRPRIRGHKTAEFYNNAKSRSRPRRKHRFTLDVPKNGTWLACPKIARRQKQGIES